MDLNRISSVGRWRLHYVCYQVFKHYGWWQVHYFFLCGLRRPGALLTLIALIAFIAIFINRILSVFETQSDSIIFFFSRFLGHWDHTAKRIPFRPSLSSAAIHRGSDLVKSFPRSLSWFPSGLLPVGFALIVALTINPHFAMHVPPLRQPPISFTIFGLWNSSSSS